MFIKRLKQCACLMLICLGWTVGTSEAQDWNGWQYPVHYYGQLPETERVYLYSPQHGWRLLPVVRGGQLPPGYPQPTVWQRPSSPYAPSVHWTGYRDFWVPLNEVHLYQNDPRFRVVLPKQTPVTPVLPPKPQTLR